MKKSKAADWNWKFCSSIPTHGFDAHVGENSISRLRVLAKQQTVIETLRNNWICIRFVEKLRENFLDAYPWSWCSPRQGTTRKVVQAQIISNSRINKKIRSEVKLDFRGQKPEWNKNISPDVKHETRDQCEESRRNEGKQIFMKPDLKLDRFHFRHQSPSFRFHPLEFHLHAAHFNEKLQFQFDQFFIATEH